MDRIEDIEAFKSIFAAFMTFDIDATREKMKATRRLRLVTLRRKLAIGVIIAAGALYLIIRSFFHYILPAFEQHPRRSFHSLLAPPGNYASLQLFDGSILDVASHPVGKMKVVGCITICRCTDSTMAFPTTPGCTENSSANDPGGFNILRTPRGGRYKAFLQDNYEVQLNAASTLRFPARFDSARREVFLQGEAFFSIRPSQETDQSSKAFVVKVATDTAQNKTVTITMLAADFDIRAYPGEGGIRTTLLEGELRMETGGHVLDLKAGQSAMMDKNGAIRLDSTVLASGTSWREGAFRFEGQRLETILDELSRWYDARIVYLSDLPSSTYNLTGIRDQPLDDLMNCLQEQGNFHYQISADTIYVSH